MSINVVYLHMSRYFLVTLLFFVGCNDGESSSEPEVATAIKHCLMINCWQGLEIDLGPQLSDGDYRVSVSTENGDGLCTFTMKEGALLNSITDCSGGTIGLTLSGGVVEVSGVPTVVGVRVETAGGEIVSAASFLPEYIGQRPSAEACTPLCFRASVSMDRARWHSLSNLR